MSESCGCNPSMNAVDKVRRKGISTNTLPTPFEILCECDSVFTMSTHEAKCPTCDLVYGVTPCGAHSVENVVAVGYNY